MYIYTVEYILVAKMFRGNPFLLEVVFVDCGKNVEINPQNNYVPGCM